MNNMEEKKCKCEKIFNNEIIDTSNCPIHKGNSIEKEKEYIDIIKKRLSTNN